MTPLIVTDRDGDLELVIGSPGGSSIITYTARTTISILDWNLPVQDAINAGHATARTETVAAEISRFPAGLADALTARGWQLEQTSLGEVSGIQAVRVTPRGLEGGAGILVGDLDLVGQRLGTDVIGPLCDGRQNVGFRGVVGDLNVVFDFQIGIFERRDLLIALAVDLGQVREVQIAPRLKLDSGRARENNANEAQGRALLFLARGYEATRQRCVQAYQSLTRALRLLRSGLADGE